MGVNSIRWVLMVVKQTAYHKLQDEKKMELFRAAIKQQTDILLRTILGHGMDNHLLGLKQIAIDNDLPVPKIFKDEAYLKVHHFTLSTSQVCHLWIQWFHFPISVYRVILFL